MLNKSEQINYLKNNGNTIENSFDQEKSVSVSYHDLQRKNSESDNFIQEKEINKSHAYTLINENKSIDHYNFSLNKQDFTNVFEYLTRKGFDIASLGKNQIIGIKRKKNNYFGACFKKILCNFLNIKSSITLIHFNFKLNFLESNIRMEMKLVKGNKVDFKTIVNELIKDLKSKETNWISDSKIHNCYEFPHFEKDESNINISNLNLEKVRNSETNYNKTNSYLFFYHLLAIENNIIGCKVQKDIRKFKGKYKNLVESAELLPNPIQDFYEIIQRTNENIEIFINTNPLEVVKCKQFTKFYAKAYFFSKLHNHLVEIYKSKWKEFNLRFQLKKEKFAIKTNMIKIYKLLEIPNEYWFFSNEFKESNNEFIVFQNDANKNMTFDLNETIDHLNNFEKTKNFIEKFFILIMTLNKLKMEMLKFRNENVEENDSIEIQNALLMVIFLYSKVEFPMAHLLMIEDFISFHKEYDKEKNIILKFKIALQYINEELNL